MIQNEAVSIKERLQENITEINSDFYKIANQLK